MITSYPNTLATIVYHLNASHSSPFGDMRWDLYEGYYIPHSIHDGLYDAWPYTTYESKFLSRQTEPTDVTIDMAVFGTGATREVYARVCIESGGTGKSMKIWMAQALDYWGESYLNRNGAKAGNNGIDVTLAADECAVVSEVFTLDADSLAYPDDVKFFAWAQEPVFVQVPNPDPPPEYYSWAEVYQAAKALAPFEGIFTDGFESGGTTHWTVVAF